MKQLAAVLAGLLLVCIPPAHAVGADCSSQDHASSNLGPGNVAEVVASRGGACVREAGADVIGGGGYPFVVTTVVDTLTFEGCPTGEMFAAVEHRSIRFAGDQGAVLFHNLECVPYGSVDPAVVVPPSSGAVWDVVREQLPLPAVRLSPGEKGLVGLETWFWADPVGEGLTQVDHDGDAATPPRWGLTVTASVVGVTTTATVWIDEYRWQIDDGLTLTAPRPGSEPDPAATHTYARKGPRQLVASTVWRGTWESPVGGGNLGPAELVGSPLDYYVHEVRGVPADH